MPSADIDTLSRRRSIAAASDSDTAEDTPPGGAAGRPSQPTPQTPAPTPEIMLMFFKTPLAATLHRSKTCLAIRKRESFEVEIGAIAATQMVQCKMCCG